MEATPASTARPIPPPVRILGVSHWSAAAVAILCSVAVVGLFRMPAVSDALLRAEGHLLLFEQPLQNIVLPRGEREISVMFPVRNISRDKVTLTGFDGCCGTRLLTALPLAVPAGSTTHISLIFSGSPEALEPALRTVQFIVDRPSPPIVLQARLLPSAHDSRQSRH